jgi:deazaflavin-dependent oxidoreductase (nitroreductase family)
MTDLSHLESESFCYLTTVGRVSGAPHEIEIWFALRDTTICMLSGGGERSDWVKNILVNPDVSVRIRDTRFEGRARVVRDPAEESWAREALLARYAPTYSGDLTRWSRESLLVAVVLGDAGAVASG